MIFDEESANDAQKFLAPPKRMILKDKIDAKKSCTKRKKVEVMFGPKTTSKTQTVTFTPSPRLVKKK